MMRFNRIAPAQSSYANAYYYFRALKTRGQPVR